MEKCLMPWQAMTITGQGAVKPCCQFLGPANSLHFDKDKSIVDCYNHESLQEIRSDFLSNKKPSACESCWERESSINYSRRIWFKEKFGEFISPKSEEQNTTIINSPELIQLDINLSNRCNLKCRMCGVWASHSWIDDEKLLLENSNPFSREANKEKLTAFDLSMERLEEIVPLLDKVRRIDFKGGEPFLAKNHVAFLKMLIEKNLNEQVTLHYTTNGTVVNNEILEVLSQFKSVHITFSIEGTGDLYSYIRGGKYSTDDLLKNLSIYSDMDNVQMSTNVTIQAYNLFNLRELYNFLQEITFENYSPKNAFQCIVNKPNYLSPFVWPLNIRERAMRDLENISDFDSLCLSLQKKPWDSDLYNTFIKFTNRLDQIRGESFVESVPQVKEYLG